MTRWKTWLRALIEDMFVIDAATLYCQRTRSGRLVALQQLDGATIKRVIDDWGRTPQPYRGADGAMVHPPAYQQVLKGLPAVNYAARDIIYRPRNVRVHKIYGYSPVQQVLMTVNIALRRQLWQLDYFTEGSIPDALIGVPQGWTPEQIRQFQDYWDTEFSGDLARRRRAKFVPGDTASRVHQTKEPEHKGEFDEWLARIICFAFSVPPQWAVKLMNRATADNQSAQSEEEGLEPTKEWVKELIDELIAEEFASPDLELHWLDEDDSDAGASEAVLEARLKLGAVTLNELRASLGLDPFANAAADRPMVLTGSGYVPIEANVGGEENGDARKGVSAGAGAKAEPGAAAEANGANENEPAESIRKYGYSPDEPRIPKHHTGGGQWTKEEAGGTSLATADTDISDGRQRYAELDTSPNERQTDATTGEPSSSDSAADDSPQLAPIPVVDFSDGLHDAVVDAWMAEFQRYGYPAVKELAIRLVGATEVFGRLDVLTKAPFCGVCALEMKTGVDPPITENQQVYIPLLQLGGHVYSTDPRVSEVGLFPGLPFPPMAVYIIWQKPGETQYKIFMRPPAKKPGP